MALDAFRTTLDPGRKEARQVPVVVVLDDAQWADPVTLEFVERLLAESLAGGWPCLVIATHWEREWHEQNDEDPTYPGPPRRLAHIPQRLRPPLKQEPYALGKVPDLSRMLSAALPGLTVPQSRGIAAKADGNPLHLIEIIHYLQVNRPLFVNRDTHGPLAPGAEEKLSRETLDYHRLVQKRFDALGDCVKDVLGWSSYQGVRFLREITREAANRLNPACPSAEIEGAIKAAERPHAIVQHFEANLSEFRQAAFHEVARRYLDLDDANVRALRGVIREAMARWVNDGRIEQLPVAERLDALLIATRELDAAPAPGVAPDAADVSLALWAKATVMLLDVYREQLLWEQARQIACRLADRRPADGGWPLDVLDFWTQIKVVDTLTQFLELDEARRMTEDLTAHARRRADTAATSEQLHNLGASLERLGNAEMAAGQRDVARRAFVEGLEVTRRVVERFGETPEALRDVSVSLDNVGDVELAENGAKAALPLYAESLGLRRRIVERFGETPKALRDVSVSLNKVGDVERAENGAKAALPRYAESLALRRRIVERFGETPQARAGRVGVAGEGRRRGTGRERGQGSLPAVRRVAGPEPADRRAVRGDAAGASGRVGVAGQGRRRGAGGERGEGGAAAVRRVAGPVPADRRAVRRDARGMRDVSVSLDRVGDVELAENGAKAALPAVRRVAGPAAVDRRAVREDAGGAAGRVGVAAPDGGRAGGRRRQEGGLGRMFREALRLFEEVGRRWGMNWQVKQDIEQTEALIQSIEGMS